MNVFVPAQPFPPGEFLQEELDARGWAIEDLADVTGITKRQLINILQSKSGITPESAMAFAQAFGQEAHTWMNIQAAYELANAAQEDRDIARRAKVFGKAPIRELKRRGWIADTNDTNQLEQEVCRLFQIATIDAVPDLVVAARKGTSYDADTAGQIAWYCRCREIAPGVAAGKYTDANWAPGVEKLLALAANEADTRLVPKVLAEMGVRLLLVQHLRHTKIDGVAFWLDDHSPVIALSLRFDRIDNFWFTLLHEMIHVKYRDKSPVDVDIQDTCGLSAMEMRANAEAASCLVPADKLESFIARVRPHFYQAKVVQFAQARKVHPGIVVGQLHRHPRGLDYRQLRKLLVKVKEHIAGNALTDGWQSATQDE